MTCDARTREFYDAEARAYAARAHHGAFLTEFMGELPSAGRILDLGCGGGQDSAAFRDAGFRVVSVDASEGLAAEAKRVWNIDVRVMDFTEIDFDEEFDGAWASGSLHHARGAELPAILRRVRRALKRGGLLNASLKADAEDRRDKFGRFFCAMDETTLAALAADWSDVRLERHEGTGYDREPTPWLRLSARA